MNREQADTALDAEQLRRERIVVAELADNELTIRVGETAPMELHITSVDGTLTLRGNEPDSTAGRYGLGIPLDIFID